MPGGGQLRSLVQFDRLTANDDGAGGGGNIWTGLLTTRGQLLPERGREALAAGRLQSASMGVLKLRSSSASRAVTEADTAVIDGVRHQIRAITNPDQHNRWLEMVVEKGVAL